MILATIKQSKTLIFFILVSVFVLLIVGISHFPNDSQPFNLPAQWGQAETTDSIFTLKKGDLLLRPNWPWLPGSYKITMGRKYGHVAIVVEGSEAATIEEALRKAVVVEALFFDQGSHRFLFERDKQVRKTSASVSFGKKFAGLRYRLRMSLKPIQADSICRFLENQLDAGYNVLSLKGKRKSATSPGPSSKIYNRKSWNCATLTWQAFNLNTGTDIDCNGGLVIYPSDIIGCPEFSGPEGRVRF